VGIKLEFGIWVKVYGSLIRLCGCRNHISRQRSSGETSWTRRMFPAMHWSSRRQDGVWTVCFPANWAGGRRTAKHATISALPPCRLAGRARAHNEFIIAERKDTSFIRGRRGPFNSTWTFLSPHRSLSVKAISAVRGVDVRWRGAARRELSCVCRRRWR